MVEITGTEEQKQKAKQMIEDLTIPAGDYQRWGEREARKNNIQINDSAPAPINWGELKRQNDEFQAAKFADMPEIKKNFYRENKKIATMDPLDVAVIR